MALCWSNENDQWICTIQVSVICRGLHFPLSVPSAYMLWVQQANKQGFGKFFCGDPPDPSSSLQINTLALHFQKFCCKVRAFNLSYSKPAPTKRSSASAAIKTHLNTFSADVLLSFHAVISRSTPRRFVFTLFKWEFLYSKTESPKNTAASITKRQKIHQFI